MRQDLNHERHYRGAALLDRLGALSITICGAGALGANLAETLARQGAGRLTVIDHDRVEAGNLGTQPYTRADVGGPKADALAYLLYEAVGVEVEPRRATLDQRTARKLLRGADLVIDCFDNTAARSAVQAEVRRTGTPCLHVGMAGDGYAEVIWDATYRVPDDRGVDQCDYPLARNLVLLATTVAAEVVLQFIANGQTRGYTLTLGDLAVRPDAMAQRATAG